MTLQDLKPLGLLDLYRQGSTWVASIRLKNGALACRRARSRLYNILKPLDLYRQGSTWVASIRLKNGRLTNLPLEATVVTRKAALQFLKAELEKSYSSALQLSSRSRYNCLQIPAPIFLVEVIANGGDFSP